MSAVLSFPTLPVAALRESALRRLYSAIDTYAERLSRSERVSGERIHAMKETGRVSLFAGSSLAMAISDAKHDDAVRHRARGNGPEAA